MSSLWIPLPSDTDHLELIRQLNTRMSRFSRTLGLPTEWDDVTGKPTTFAPSAHTHPFTELTGSIASAQVPQAAVTQHQAALSIAASQVTAGTFGEGDFTFRTTAGNQLTLRANQGTNGALIGKLAFYQEATSGLVGSIEMRRQSTTYNAYMSFLTRSGSAETERMRLGAGATVDVFGTLTATNQGDGASVLRLDTERAWAFEQFDTGPQTGLALRAEVANKFFQIRHMDGRVVAAFGASDSASSGLPLHLTSLNQDEVLRVQAPTNPYISFYQGANLRAYAQFINALGLQLGTTNGLPVVAAVTGDEVLRIRHGSSTGNPYISFYQTGTRRAFFQFLNSGKLRMKNEVSGIIEFTDSVIEIGPSVAGTPSANHGRLYTVSSGTQLWYRDPSGTNTRIV